MTTPYLYQISPRASKIDNATSDDVPLAHPFVSNVPSLSGPCLVATDGRILAAHRLYPLEDAPLPSDGQPVASEAVEAACKLAGRGADFATLGTGDAKATVLPNGATYPVPHTSPTPVVAHVIPASTRDGDRVFAVDPKLLIALIKALGAEKDASVTFHIPAPVERGGSRGPAVIAPILMIPSGAEGGSLGVIMPVAR